MTPSDAVATPGSPVSSQKPLRIVGIGASAGGLEALERFFENVPLDTGMAFVVVQHLSPDFRSMMDELLARRTKLPVQLVEDGVVVLPNHVYLIPPKKEMIISGGKLLLSERDRQSELSLPIDVFFRSLAQDCGPRSAAIVLSGGGSDGSRGIRDIHEAGGLVIVQDTGSAQFDGMPKTAREAGVAHWVLAPEDMPGALLEHANRSAALDTQVSPRRAGDAPSARRFEPIYQMLEREFGIDFTHYKPSTVTRRIERRLALARSRDLPQYIERLRTEHDELDVLYRDLLIGVTRFFRDEEAFALLEQRVLPELLRKSPREAPIRIWVAGCATGEEVYSLAIAIQDAMARLGERPVNIFATDIHPGSIERAARGIYDEEAVANVTPERLERYFVRLGRSYQVSADIRKMVVFAAHNVIKDAPFTRIDLITCRNLLIYLQPPAQQRALTFFHFALSRGGVLFLGPSESPGHLANDFEVVDAHWRIYRKFSDVRIPVELRLQPGKPSAGARTAASLASRMAPRPSQPSAAQLLGTYDTLLDELMPPSLLVTERGELVHSFGGASRFLKPRDGRPPLDLFEQVDGRLKMVLMSGLRRASASDTAVVFKGVRIGEPGTKTPYKISVRRLRPRTAGPLHLLISFEAAKDDAPEDRAAETEIDLKEISTEQVGALEAELVSTKENLQAAIEQLEASNEELQASNEELLASNEELQSTNEELQSVNEELYTVNAEYQRKIAELTELNNDMDNLLSSTEVGTIFLDKQLKIRKFTPKIADTFNLVSHDLGRPIATFAHTMDHPGLEADLGRCLATGETVERTLRGRRGSSFFLRILPYRAKGAADGVVLTLIDVTGMKAAEDALFHERYLLNSLMQSVPDAIYFKDIHGCFIRVNHAAAARLGVEDGQDIAGKSALELVSSEARSMVLPDAEVIRTREAMHYKLENRIRADGTVGWDLVTRLPLKDPSDHVVGVIGIFRDVTEQKRAEEKIRDAVRRRDQFLAMLSHELRNPLSAIVTSTQLLKTNRAPGGRAGSETKFLEILERQSMQMSRLLDDLLEASRVTQNKIELRRSTLDLRRALREAADAVRGLMESRGIELRVNVDGAPLHVSGDPARLQQVHVNLLSNAAKYTPRGGHVLLSVERDGAEAVVCVRDDGAGIPREMLDSVFDLFVQSPRTLDRAQGGLGLGLTLVRSLVAMHDGTVVAHSDGEGKGSEFVVRFPLAAGAVQEERAAPRPASQRAGGTKVVIVEDSSDSREMLCEYLTRSGFDCRSAESGIDGVALIEEMRPDWAVIDVGLPGMDGLEVARRVRNNPDLDTTYLIALTGYGQPADRAAAHAAGFDEHLVKPVLPERLLTLLSGQSSTPPAPAPAPN